MYDKLNCTVLTGGDIMRSCATRWSLIALLLVLTCGSASHAALTEKKCLDGINDTVSLLRYYHRVATDAQYNLDLCRAARALTQKQLDLEKTLFDKAKSKGQTDEADFFQQRMTRLESQLSHLAEFKYEETYSTQISKSKVQIVKLEAIVAARVEEYELLFSKKTQAQISFDEEMAKYRPHRENMAYYLILD
jgi:hypothetical protein